MTKEGRLKTHLQYIKLGKTSPYANEFKDVAVPRNDVKVDTSSADIPKGKTKFFGKKG